MFYPARTNDNRAIGQGGDITKIQIFQIKVNAGRREVSPEAVHELADSISKVGLLNPITVDKDYTLIAGLHRLEAAKLLGWTEIECNVSDLEGLMVELAEIDENFVRKGLSKVEYGELLLHRKEIYEALHPETRRGMRNGQTSKTADSAVLETKSFIQDTAEKTGKAPRTIEIEVQTAKKLTPEAKEIIRMADAKINKTNVLKLSRLAPAQQADAARQLAEEKIHSVDQYHPTPAESELAEEQAPQLPAPQSEVPAPSVSGTGYYPTIRDSVADLKNPNKDRSITPDSFLMSFSLFLQRFCQNVESYAVNEYEPVFPALTRDHLGRIQQEISAVHSTLDNLFNIIERKSNK